MAKFEDRCFISFGRWFVVFFKCKDLIWVEWKSINEDGQMGGEPINKTALLNHIVHKTELTFSDYQKIEKIRSLEICWINLHITLRKT